MIFSAMVSACAGSPAVSPFSAVISFYRGPLDHLGSVRHGECPMIPSCSEYAAQAVAAHGEILGWIIACDRLMRCGRDELQLSKSIYVDGKLKTDDPLAANDFWWNSPAIPSE